MTIGERIKQRRIELGLTQTELAHRLGNKSRTSVCTVETNKEDLTTDRIRKYAEALETTPAYLMGWEETNAFRRRNTFTDVETKKIKGVEITTYKATPSVPESELNELEKAYMDAITSAEILKRYSELLKNPQIQRLLKYAEKCDPEQIELAINVLGLKKA